MSRRFHNIQFTTKLFAAGVTITIGSILIKNGNAINMAHRETYTQGKHSFN